MNANLTTREPADLGDDALRARAVAAARGGARARIAATERSY